MFLIALLISNRLFFTDTRDEEVGTPENSIPEIYKRA
jgi:hypothetical protein